MTWDPSVLRKYNTTGHFRLLSQLRSELKASPLVRPKAGESVGEVNRSRSLIRAIAEKAAATRQRRASKSDGIDSVTPDASGDVPAEPELAVPH